MSFDAFKKLRQAVDHAEHMAKKEVEGLAKKEDVTDAVKKLKDGVSDVVTKGFKNLGGGDAEDPGSIAAMEDGEGADE